MGVTLAVEVWGGDIVVNNEGGKNIAFYKGKLTNGCMYIHIRVETIWM
jgi:hypothetical protein